MDSLSSAFQKLSKITDHNLKKASTWISHRFARESSETKITDEVSSRFKKRSGRRSTKSGRKKPPPSRKAEAPLKNKTSDTAPPIETDQKRPQPEFAVLLIGGGLFLFLGQVLMPVVHQTLRWQAIIFSLLGVGLFVLAAHGFTTGSLPRAVSLLLEKASGWLQLNSAQVIMVILSPFISFAAGLAAGDTPQMKLPEIAIIAWLLAISLMILGNWQAKNKPRVKLWSWPEIVAVVAIFLFAFLVRGLWTDQIPWALSGDEGSAGLFAVDFANGNRDNIFSIGWYSFPSLFFFIQSLSVFLFGQSIIALRLLSALTGALTVVGLYWYARNTFGRGIALASAAYLAGFHYHIHFSRIGLNNIWDGLFMVVFAGMLWRAWTSGQRLMYVLAGFTLGLAQYFYTSSRGLFLLVPVWLVIAAIKDRKSVRHRLPGLTSLFLATVVIVMPLANFFIHHPDEFLAPHVRVTILGNWVRNEATRTGNPTWMVIGNQIKESALGFTSRNLRHWYQPDHPMLLPLPAALFLLGLVLLLLKLTDLRNIWLVLWLIVTILMGGLSESAPAAQRYVLVAPAVALIVALPIITSLQWLSRLWRSQEKALIVIISFLLIIAIGIDLNFYFGDYTPNKRFGDLNTETATALGYYLAEQEAGMHVYFFGPPRMGYFSLSTIPYLAPEAIGHEVINPITSPPDWSLEGPTAFVFLPERQEELVLVKERHPEGTEFYQRGKDDILLFISYQVD